MIFCEDFEIGIWVYDVKSPQAIIFKKELLNRYDSESDYVDTIELKEGEPDVNIVFHAVEWILKNRKHQTSKIIFKYGGES